MVEKVQITKQQLQPLKSALRDFSKFLTNASDDFAFEMGILADTPRGIVIQLQADAIDGSEHELLIENLTANSISYSATRNNKYTREWEKVGLRGDHVTVFPLYNKVIQALIGLGIVVDRIDWDVFGACNGTLDDITFAFNPKTKGNSIRLLSKRPFGEDDY